MLIPKSVASLGEAAKDECVHTVKNGDTLFDISKKYNVDGALLCALRLLRMLCSRCAHAVRKQGPAPHRPLPPSSRLTPPTPAASTLQQLNPSLKGGDFLPLGSDLVLYESCL